MRERFVLPQRILVDRRPTLASYARSLRARGYDEDQIRKRLHEANHTRCKPPRSSVSDLKKLDKLAAWAAKFSPGYAGSQPLNEELEDQITNTCAFVHNYPWRGCWAKNNTSLGVCL